ncbi:hypothetical protein D9757_002825 [Collybiopsis confluens]|uniref:AMP-dependent synthetase/ligase domain-containing protein n=1 Tax=Collybiopsis confluens TaxID=2823264 RepID=A0A8H5HVN3_9AGAR|nr:hypothetical protein D9757_002825 [Collybiopsis confluens]
MSRTHLSVLESSTARFSNSAVFKVPLLDPQTHLLLDWTTITYQQFHDDVHRSASFWIGGYTYQDVVAIYGLSRAGFIPQLFSLRLPNPQVIFELLVKAEAKALIFDPTFSNVLQNCHTPIYQLNAGIEPCLGSVPLIPVVAKDDTALIFHTSGSTSGSPKLVRCSYRWLDSIVDKASQTSMPHDAARSDVTTWMYGEACATLDKRRHGACVIQPTTISFSSEELIRMVESCGLNRLNQFAAFLAMQLRAARKNPALLSLLAGLDEVLYSGMPLPQEEQSFALQNNIKLRNLFGSTECSILLLSVGGSGNEAPLLKPLNGVSYQFVPIDSEDAEGHHSTVRLLELVVRSESPDCPEPSRRSSDGHFHSGDLFQEPLPGCYVFCGRDDDWIKSENSLRCDTKAIEDNIRATCGNLVADCIVVGAGRPSPVLFVESAVEVSDQEKFKKEIIRKTRHFHSRRYLHERIVSTKMIVVVDRNTLPRTATKGNIRRQAVEETYRGQLDEIYGLAQ